MNNILQRLSLCDNKYKKDLQNCTTRGTYCFKYYTRHPEIIERIKESTISGSDDNKRKEEIV